MEYPKDYINQIIQGDCLEVMKGIPDKSVDLVLTDPPYGLGICYKNYNDTQDNLKVLISSFCLAIVFLISLIFSSLILLKY